MTRYLFSLFVRFFIAITGFIAFIVSARLYGPEGRGIIAYGTSLISIFALILSLNLGRSFLIETHKNSLLKSKLIHEYVALNFLLVIITVLLIFIYWLLSPALRAFITLQQVLIFSIIAPYYLWTVNGTVIFAVMNLTYKQEVIILITRILLVAFLIITLMNNSLEINEFIWWYGLILGGGAFFEMFFLGNPLRGLRNVFNFSRFMDHIRKSLWPHLDYLAFNTFHLFLILFGTFFLGFKEAGRLNFAIQLVSFVFLLSVVASIRIKSYVASEGSNFHFSRIKVIFFITLSSSFALSLLIFFLLRSSLYSKYFSVFGDVHSLFFILIFSLPGYMAYQFLYPISIESNHIKLSAKLTLSIFCLFLIISLLTIPVWQSFALCSIYCGFYTFVMLVQLYINRSIFKSPNSTQ